MQIEARIISASNSRPIHKIDVIDSRPGLTRDLIRVAEAEAREWAAQNGMRVVTDTFSQGAYRAWVETA